MSSVLRAVAVYGVLFIVLRVSGKRTLSQISSLDLVVLLVIGEATQQALLGDDFSVTNAAVVIVTLVLLNVVLDWVIDRFRFVERVLDGSPLILISSGEILEDRLSRARVDRGDIIEAARSNQGLERIADIKYAVLEKNGDISIIPWS